MAMSCNHLAAARYIYIVCICLDTCYVSSCLHIIWSSWKSFQRGEKWIVKIFFGGGGDKCTYIKKLSNYFPMEASILQRGPKGASILQRDAPQWNPDYCKQFFLLGAKLLLRLPKGNIYYPSQITGLVNNCYMYAERFVYNLLCCIHLVVPSGTPLLTSLIPSLSMQWLD